MVGGVTRYRVAAVIGEDDATDDDEDEDDASDDDKDGDLLLVV